MAQPDLNLGAAASATQHGVYSGVDSPSGDGAPKQDVTIESVTVG